MNTEIVWFADRPVAQVTPGGPILFTFTDHLGTPTLQTDSTAAITWRVEYEPFGNVYEMRAGTRTDQPLRFPGQELAMTWEGPEENYNVFRWYRSAWGRMTQPDPLLNLGFARSLQMFLEDAPSVSFDRVDWYGYAANNPLFFIDPLGLKVKNNTNCRIYVKDATTNQVYPLYPGQGMDRTTGRLCGSVQVPEPGLQDRRRR